MTDAAFLAAAAAAERQHRLAERIKQLARRGWDTDMVAALLDIPYAAAARVMGDKWNESNVSAKPRGGAA
jgi:hypothetical protein